MSEPYGTAPQTGWAKMVPELLVRDFDASPVFWRDIVGFEVAYRRYQPRFIYLERREGAQIMLCERRGKWETGPTEPSCGRGDGRSTRV